MSPDPTAAEVAALRAEITALREEVRRLTKRLDGVERRGGADRVAKAGRRIIDKLP